MYRGCHNSFDEPSLASFDTSYFSPELERIDNRAFSYCDSLENVSFPPALKNILEIVLLSQWNVVLLRSYMVVEYYN